MEETASQLERSGYISPDALACLKTDFVDFFPSSYRQLFFDMISGTASSLDYPYTQITTGCVMP